MQVVLVMFRADGERRSFSVVRDMTVIGRREDCDLRIPVGDISRKHARLIRDGDTIRVEDLGSSNGTFHNGQRVQEAVLSPGDLVQLGPVSFIVQIDGVPADDEIQPALPAAEEAEEGFAVVDDSAPSKKSARPSAPASGNENAEFDFTADEGEQNVDDLIDFGVEDSSTQDKA
jgi:pSer/pThr/pTyr-binding forkhead associated (FHA) protein